MKACYRSMRRELKQELVILDEKTVFDLITLPNYIVEKWKAGLIRHAHFTDICRVELLYKYGGVWIDSTDFITSPIPKEIMDADFFMFLAGKKVAAWFSFVQNCFIRARKGDPLLGYWREAIFTYWKNEDRTVNYFIHQLIFRFIIEHNNQAQSLFGEMPQIDQDPTHILWFDHKDDPFDREKFLKLTEPTFFQKTTYRDESAVHPHPGTIADHIIQSR